MDFRSHSSTWQVNQILNKTPAKKKRRQVQKGQEKKRLERKTQTKVSTEQFFDSFMNLRQGANYYFSGLVNNALEATDNIMEMQKKPRKK